MRFIQAKNWKWANRQSVWTVVIHTMEAPENTNTAEAVASWFAGPNAPMASAHVCVDSDSIVECVKPEHIAFAAPGANSTGYHIEIAGRAAQTDEQWADAYSAAALEIAAQQAAAIAVRYNIPIVKIGPTDLIGGGRGFCGHIDVTTAFHKSTHTDPGPRFPWSKFMDRVRYYTSQERINSGVTVT